MSLVSDSPSAFLTLLFCSISCSFRLRQRRPGGERLPLRGKQNRTGGFSVLLLDHWSPDVSVGRVVCQGAEDEEEGYSEEEPPAAAAPASESKPAAADDPTHEEQEEEEKAEEEAGGHRKEEGKGEEKGNLAGERQSGDGQVRLDPSTVGVLWVLSGR